MLATTVVTTIAGSLGLSGSLDGTGSNARFSLPAGLAADGKPFALALVRAMIAAAKSVCYA